MLRAALLVFACLLSLIGVVCVLTGSGGAWPMVLWGTVLLAAVLFERWRYHPSKDDDAGNWRKTDERFVDPESGQLMQVLYRPDTGDRRYVPADDVQANV